MKPSLSPGAAPNWRGVFGAPIVIGVLSFAGLILALLVEGGIGRYASWLMVGLPLIICGWRYARSRR
ncbi:hypothetical protein [Bradyrhizobium prioriisuperbiae]|uniref:hypothetical protein n=1 Tax=Bradyrhizobium prioriisuperbiae TaxID=2854389 RepID=UPI0028EC778A|nr:hypothetical protein [Bradyrhizobium prioritasuperba]